MTIDLKKEWEDLLTKYVPNQLLVGHYWEEIVKQYTKKRRKYHNLEHLQDFFTRFQKAGFQEGELDVFKFAIFYHDLIYNPLHKDNEKKSAILARKRLHTFGLTASQSELCYQIILATEHHQADSPINHLGVLPYFLDFDLAILGADNQLYTEYAQKIRQEYWMYPDFLYQKGRIKALEKFLLRPFIYQTYAYQRLYEEQARENLTKEIELLEKNS